MFDLTYTKFWQFQNYRCKFNFYPSTREIYDQITSPLQNTQTIYQPFQQAHLPTHVNFLLYKIHPSLPVINFLLIFPLLWTLRSWHFITTMCPLAKWISHKVNIARTHRSRSGPSPCLCSIIFYHCTIIFFGEYLSCSIIFTNIKSGFNVLWD